MSLTPRLILAVLCLTAGQCLQAHGPFDNSSQVIVRDDVIEVVVTMGMEASRQLLFQSGHADGTAMLLNRGPSTPTVLPLDLAAKFFDAEADQTLSARNISVITDGLEAAFTIIYPRPALGDLRFRALYFNSLEMMRPGSFIVTDENRNTLGVAMLSRANASFEIKLSGAVPAMPVMAEATRHEPASTTAHALPASVPTQATTAHVAKRTGAIWFLALLIVATFLWFDGRRLTRSR